jgi:lipid-A-disaccharide synthase-like uncharacterized protein
MIDIIFGFFSDIFMQLNDPWKVFGIAAQGLFMMRFLVQWLASEKAGQSVIPEAFWYFSILGALSLLVYGIREREIVIIMGQSLPLVIYWRNLRLIYKNKRQQEKILNHSVQNSVPVTKQQNNSEIPAHKNTVKSFEEYERV